VQVNREALLDRAEQILIPLDFQIRMQAALHEHARAAQLDGFLDLLIDHLVRQEVTFGVAHGPVKGAEAAILGAEVGVVDIAIDDVGNDALGVPLAADGVGGHPETDQVIGTEQIEPFFPSHHS
jgi:hypothetical protein